MATLLLVHGGWAGSWAWDQLLPELDALGVSYRAVTLPGHDSNSGALWSVSLADYSEHLANAAMETDDRVILVGHSSSGFVITAAASHSPECFDELVYLAALVPIEGERLASLAFGDKESKLGPGVRPNPFLGYLSLHPSVWRDALFHDCDDASERQFAKLVVKEPLRPGLTKLKLNSGFNKIPKSYVLCTNDHAMTTNYQRWMAERSGVPIRYELQCGHMPMNSNPKELARVLADYAHAEPNEGRSS